MKLFDLVWNRLQKIDMSALPTYHSLSNLNIARNLQPSIIFPALPFDVSSVSITREEDYSENQDFRLWRMYVADPSITKEFRELIREDPPTHAEDGPEKFAQLVDTIYAVTDAGCQTNLQLTFEQIEMAKAQSDQLLGMFEMYAGIEEYWQEYKTPQWLELFTREQQQIRIYRIKSKQQEEVPDESNEIARDVPLGQPDANFQAELGGPIAAGPIGPPPLPAFDATQGDYPDIGANSPPQNQQNQEDEEEFELIVETMEVPVGTECADCHTELYFPYYYYFVSKVHRCIDCAEKQNPQAERKLERYAVNENAILMFAQKQTVDVKRCGSNIQPKEEG